MQKVNISPLGNFGIAVSAVYFWFTWLLFQLIVFFPPLNCSKWSVWVYVGQWWTFICCSSKGSGHYSPVPIQKSSCWLIVILAEWRGDTHAEWECCCNGTEPLVLGGGFDAGGGREIVPLSPCAVMRRGTGRHQISDPDSWERRRQKSVKERERRGREWAGKREERAMWKRGGGARRFSALQDGTTPH